LGAEFRLTYKGFWRPVWSVLADSGQSILSIRPCDKAVELTRDVRLPEERLSLLAIFTWHIIRQTAEDAAASAAVAVVVTP